MKKTKQKQLIEYNIKHYHIVIILIEGIDIKFWHIQLFKLLSSEEALDKFTRQYWRITSNYKKKEN